MPAVSHAVFTPLRTKNAPASCNSCQAALPVGVSAVGGGGSVKPMGKTLRVELTTSTPSLLNPRWSAKAHCPAASEAATIPNRHLASDEGFMCLEYNGV